MSDTMREFIPDTGALKREKYLSVVFVVILLDLLPKGNNSKTSERWAELPLVFSSAQISYETELLELRLPT